MVTGGASGIGRAMAESFAGEGMRVVMADIEAEALGHVAGALRATGASVLAVATDVSKAEQVRRWPTGGRRVRRRRRRLQQRGRLGERAIVGVHARRLGVGAGCEPVGRRPRHPHLRADHASSGRRGHVVNTASLAGLCRMPFMGAYNASKHAVVTLSETLHKELEPRTRSCGCRCSVRAWSTRAFSTRSATGPPRCGTPRGGAPPVVRGHGTGGAGRRPRSGRGGCRGRGRGPP